MGLFDSWYTDLADVYRNVSVKTGGITKNKRTKIHEGIPCRIYSTPASSPSMQDTAARTSRDLTMSCAVGVDIKAGDELQITRGGAIRIGGNPVRYFAGEPQLFIDPVGGALTGLEHQEIGLLENNIIN